MRLINPRPLPLFAAHRPLAAWFFVFALLGRNAVSGADGPNAPSEPLTGLLWATFKITHAESSGTCFFVSPPAAAGRPAGELVLVTAAHALEQAPGPECVIVMREKTGEEAFARREVKLKIRSGDKPLWTKHPAEDVAALVTKLPGSVYCRPLKMEQLARAEDFRRGGVRLGEDAWVFSFPAQLEANGAGYPVLRHGSVASLPQVPLDSHRTFIVDITTFGGDSGAAVMVMDRGAPPSSALIAGLVLGMHRQTDKATMPFEERTVHHPMGLAIVAHAEIIRQTIDLALK